MVEMQLPKFGDRTETERGGRETETESDRQTDRQTETERQTETVAETDRQRQTYRLTDRSVFLLDRPTDRSVFLLPGSIKSKSNTKNILIQE